MLHCVVWKKKYRRFIDVYRLLYQSDHSEDKRNKVPLKRRSISTRLHEATSQEAVILIIIAVKK
jgi:hypothetical protein